MLNNKPAIDVIIPVRNGEQYLEKAVTSVLEQSLLPNKIIIINDGSTDRTQYIITDLKKRSCLVASIDVDNKGVSAARNAGILISQSPLIAFLDSDDVWRNDKLEKQLKIIANSEESVGLIYSSYNHIDAQGQITLNHLVRQPHHSGLIFEEVLNGACISGSASSALIKRKYLDIAGLFDERLVYGEDWDLWIRLAKVCKFDYSPEPLVNIRVHNYSAQRKNYRNKRLVFLENKCTVLSKQNDIIITNKALMAKLYDEIVATLIKNLYQPIRLYTTIRKLQNLGFKLNWSNLDFRESVHRVLQKIQRESAHRARQKIKLLFRIKEGVTIQLIGGLGNQMFQYAAGLALAKKNGLEDVYIDINSFKNYKKWPYGLHNFSIPQNIWRHKHNFIQKAINTITKSNDYYVEPYFHFDSNFFELKSPIIIAGYFQSYKYFQDISHILRTKFCLKNSLSAYGEKLMHTIKDCPNSIAIHVRRGDYISDAGASKVHCTLPISYYKNAITLIQDSLLENIKFFIFSDDYDFVEDNFDFCTNKIIVKSNSSNPAEDMVLMSACKHQIIANSSFSWWGAWLNKNQSKIVIAPKAWFSAQMLEKTNISDLCPKEWLLI